jgi:CRISPR/Cas system-associated protein Cas5 (RAMP superfamily)
LVKRIKILIRKREDYDCSAQIDLALKSYDDIFFFGHVFWGAAAPFSVTPVRFSVSLTGRQKYSNKKAPCRAMPWRGPETGVHQKR